VLGPPHIRTRHPVRAFLAASPPDLRRFGPRYIATAALTELLRQRAYRQLRATAPGI
jgi:hypothetical protein